MTITQIKALFETGKIPTQEDFETLINKIPNNDSMGGDNTLDLTNPVILVYLVIDLLLLVMKVHIYL